VSAKTPADHDDLPLSERDATGIARELDRTRDLANRLRAENRELRVALLHREETECEVLDLRRRLSEMEEDAAARATTATEADALGGPAAQRAAENARSTDVPTRQEPEAPNLREHADGRDEPATSSPGLFDTSRNAAFRRITGPARAARRLARRRG
jgi:hypothetical protein